MPVRPRVIALVSRGSIERLGRIDPGGENPGIGGTEWTTLVQAARLNTAGEVAVRIVTDAPAAPSRIGEVPVTRVRDLATAIGPGVEADVVVASAAVADQLGTARIGAPLVVVLRHPYEQRRVERIRDRMTVAAFVSVGQYAWHSHGIRGIPHRWLPNPFPRWALRDPGEGDASTRTHGGPVFGFVGALLPAKGFHHVAEAWRMIHAKMHGSRLEVIGAASLYGRTAEHPTVPTSPEYAEQILEILGPAVDSVHFHGLVARGKADLISGWDVALLNPTGDTEADPSSLKEVVAAGVPPVASADFGMWDIMRHLPEFVPRSLSDTPALASRVATDAGLRATFRERRMEILGAALARDRRLDGAWAELLRSVAAGHRPGVSPTFRPARPTGRAAWRLRRRQDPLRRWLKRLHRLRLRG